MAPKRAAAKEAAVEEEEEVHLGTSLQFDEPLSWRAGKPIPTSELLQRLDRLSKELKDMDQDECDSSSLTGVAKELAAQNLLGHKDRGVRALTACCLVDILELSAPDAPFTPNQLKDIFTLLITSILPALVDPSNAYNVQHMYVLNSLAEVKSIILLADIQSSDSLILHLFTSFFDMLSKTPTGEQLSKAVEYNMGILLVTLVDEAASMPSQVIDTIIAQFLRAGAPPSAKPKHNGEVDSRQSTLLAKDFSPAYRLAKKICDDCPEKMSRYISQYFNEVILEASGTGEKNAAADSDDEGAPSGPSDADLRELEKAHRLLRELWRASSSVLQNVIPQLEAELSAENVQLRLLATETLGDIVSGIGAAGPPPAPVHDPAAYPPLRLANSSSAPLSDSVLTNPMSPESFSQTYHQVYQGFLQRRSDKSAIIRSGWATAAGRILTTSAGGIGLSRDEESVLVTGLAEKLNDADERVRLAAIRAVATFSFHDIIRKLAPHGDVNKSGSVLCSLSDRVRDKKQIVRAEGMALVAKLWGVAAAEITDGEETVVAALGAIPTKLYDAFYANDLEVTLLLEHATFEQLVPLNYPASKSKALKSSNNDSQINNGEDPFDADKLRTERILTLIKTLNSKSREAFFNLQKRQAKFRPVVKSFLDACEKWNGGDASSLTKANLTQIHAGIAKIIEWLAFFAVDKLHATADLWKFAKIHDRRNYQLIRFMMAPESDFKTVHKAIKEFTKRIEQNASAPAGMMDSLLPILYRCGSLFYNKSHLPTILALSRHDEGEFSATAHDVLKQISDTNPEVFKAQIKELCKLLEEQTPTAKQPNDQGSVQTLKACAGYARKYPEEIPTDRKFVTTLLKFAEYGTPPKSAKYAVSILMSATERKEMHAKDLLQKVTKDWQYGSDHFLTKLATISQITLSMPKLAEEVADDILEITTQQVLLKVRQPAAADDPVWQADNDMDEECEAKCLSLKVLVNRVRSSSNEDVHEMAAPVYKLLNTLVVNEGELSKALDTPRHHRSRLRLFAARLLLKLCATRRVFDDLLTAQDFINLSCVAQDACYNVRAGFMEKLKAYLVQHRLPPRFYSIVFLVAFEPEMKLRTEIMAFIQSRVKQFQDQQKQTMEAVLPRLLSLLAHHPDYSAETEDLLDTASYLLSYISAVVNQENLGLVYKYAERVKQLRDTITPGESERLYVLSDLTQAILRKWQLKKGWSMQAYSGKTGMPKDLFSPLPSHEVAQRIAEKSFIPEDLDDLLDNIIRKTASKKLKRKSEHNGPAPSAKKARASISRPGGVKKVSKPKTPGKKKSDDFESPGARTSNIPESERRRSGRGVAARSVYADRDSSDDDEEMLEGVSKWEYEDGRIEGEEQSGEGSDDEDMPDVDPDTSDKDSTPTLEPEKGDMTSEKERLTNLVVKTNGRSKRGVTAKPSRQSEKEPAEDDEEAVDSVPASKSNGRGRRGGRDSVKKSKPDPEAQINIDAEEEDEAEDATMTPEPQPIRRGRRTASPSAKKSKIVPGPEPEVVEEEEEEEEKETNATPASPPPKSGRQRVKRGAAATVDDDNSKAAPSQAIPSRGRSTRGRKAAEADS